MAGGGNFHITHPLHAQMPWTATTRQLVLGSLMFHVLLGPDRVGLGKRQEAVRFGLGDPGLCDLFPHGHTPLRVARSCHIRHGSTPLGEDRAMLASTAALPGRVPGRALASGRPRWAQNQTFLEAC